MEELNKELLPPVVELGRLLDLSSWERAPSVEIFAVLGGHLPSGSIKDVGLSTVISEATRSGSYRKGQPIAEISNHSMARSVAWLSRKIETEAWISFPGAGSEAVSAIDAGLRFLEVSTPPSAEQHPLVSFFDAFESLCREKGFFFPDQTRNPQFRRAYSLLGPHLRSELAHHGASEIVSVTGAIGTGSSLLGIADGLALSPAKRPQVVGVEPALATEPGSLPWQDIPGLRNTSAFHWSQFGRHDAYDPGAVDGRQEISLNEASEFAKLANGAGLRGGLSMGATLASAKRLAGELREGTLVVVLADACSLAQGE